jgi:hypothetical protein
MCKVETPGSDYGSMSAKAKCENAFNEIFSKNIR